MGNCQAISGNFRSFWEVLGGIEPGKKPVLINKKKAEDCTPKYLGPDPHLGVLDILRDTRNPDK